jgi:hypothetical protein
MAYDEKLADRIRAYLGPQSGIVEKKMFGGLAFLLNGHMAIAASGQGGLLVRVDPGKTRELTSRPNAGVMVMRGKEMPGWLRVNSDNMSDDELCSWIDISMSYAKSLPPKKNK